MVTNRFPADRAANRQYLLDAVDSIAEVVTANRDRSEAERTLAPASVEAIRESGLFLLKAPREVGGAEAHPADQMDVIEAMVHLDPAAAWCMFITSAVSGNLMARLGDDEVEEILADGYPFCVGSLKPGGKARRVDGGFRVSGRWAWGSGLPHADWVSVPVFTDDPEVPLISAVARARDLTHHDTWHTLGMRGTGSADYEFDDLLVPDRFTIDARQGQRRGGALYRLGMPGYVVNEHGSFAYALAQAALDEMIATAVEKKRGYGAAISIADREVFQRTIGRGFQRIGACRLLMADAMERLFDSAVDGPPSPALVAESRGAAVWCTDEALDVVGALFRYAGGGAVMDGSLIQRYLRDLQTVQSHLVVSDSAYEIHGQLLLGLIDEPPLR